MIETPLKNIAGEMTDSIRNEKHNGFAFAYNFDIPEPSRLVAKRDFTVITDNSEKIYRMLYAKFLDGASLEYHIYGMGKEADGDPKLWEKDVTETAWAAVSGAEFTTGDIETRAFFYYKNYLYLFQNGTVLSRFGDLTSSPSKTESYQALSYTNVAQPVHHPADDIAYFFQDNLVHKLDNTSWTGSALILPNNLKIVGGAPYGDYLAILCSPIQTGTAESMLYLWDRDSSLTTISAKINLGFGDAYHIGSDDNGVFITQMSQSSAVGLSEYNTKLKIKYYRGFLIEKEISSDSTFGYLKNILLNGAQATSYLNSVTVGKNFYFPATFSTTKDAVKYDVIFKCHVENGVILITPEINVPSIASGQGIEGIFELHKFWFVSYGSSPVVVQTSNSGTYASAALESVIYSVEDPSNKKDLVGITVFTEPLIAGASYTLKYRKDNETSWTTIFSVSAITAGAFVIGTEYTILSVGTTDFTLIGASANTVGVQFVATGVGTGTGTATDSSISHSAVNIESTGENFGRFNQVQFRLESTGGVNFIAPFFSPQFDVLPTKPY